MSWTLVVALALGAFGLKVLDVMILGSRPTVRVQELVALVPAAMFAGIVALETLERDESLVLDARVAGVAVAAFATWRRWPFPLVVALAMATTAAIRAVT